MARHVRELFDLSGRTALVTGGSRGLGLQVAEALGEAGATLMLTSRKATDLQQSAEALAAKGLRADWIAADASEPAEIERLAQATLDRMGSVDILVNNAGATWAGPAEDYPLCSWDKVMNLNVRSVFLLSQYIAKHGMIPRGQGRILMMGSITGFGGNLPGLEMVAYNTSKAALHNLTRTLACEWGEFGITVNALAPGFFLTKMARVAVEMLGKEAVARVPLRRYGDDENLKGAAVLLASEAGKHITGQILAIDGGMSCFVG